MKKISNSKIQTQKMAKDFARQIVQYSMLHNKGAVLIGLSGDLGSGKTAFVQGFAKALGIKTKIISPTFVILKRFKIQSADWRTRIKNLTHIDAYRIKNPKEILDLGWKELIKNPENIILVEWPEKIKKIFSKPHFWIEFTHRRKNTRGIDIRFVK